MCTVIFAQAYFFKGTGTQKNRKKTIFFEFLDYTFFDYFEPSFTYISMLDKEFLR